MSFSCLSSYSLLYVNQCFTEFFALKIDCVKCTTGTCINNQLTINPKDGKKAFSGIPTRVHHCLLRFRLLPVLPLGKPPKRLGPRLEVNQTGLCVLQWRGQLFSLAHTEKLYTHSRDFNVRVYLITFLFYSPPSA